MIDLLGFFVLIGTLLVAAISVMLFPVDSFA